MAREWAALPDVLAYEWYEAKERFPRTATGYLADYNQAAPSGHSFDESALVNRLAEAWPRSVPFRRFVLAFHRLHAHDGGAINRAYRIRLREETPIEFLLLCALLAEKLLNETYLSRNPNAEIPKFNGLVLWLVGEIASARGLNELRSKVERRLKGMETKLYDLPQTRQNPFKAAAPGSEEAILEEAFVNFVKIRNYAAHHDALDFELIHTPAARPVLQALLLIVLLAT